jgi:hypothetical protein
VCRTTMLLSQRQCGCAAQPRCCHLSLGRQSNEDKRQCKAGDEGKTKGACPRSGRRFLGLFAGSRGIGVDVWDWIGLVIGRN